MVPTHKISSLVWKTEIKQMLIHIMTAKKKEISELSGTFSIENERKSKSNWLKL